MVYSFIFEISAHVLFLEVDVKDDSWVWSCSDEITHSHQENTTCLGFLWYTERLQTQRQQQRWRHPCDIKSLQSQKQHQMWRHQFHVSVILSVISKTTIYVKTSLWNQKTAISQTTKMWRHSSDMTNSCCHQEKNKCDAVKKLHLRV